MRSTTLLAATCLALASVPVAAAEEIEVPPDAPFIHERTSIVFPPRLGDLHRRWVRDYGSAQYDVSAIYEAADGDTFLSFYVYRAGLPEASLWFDRLATIMAEREGFRPASHASLEPAAYRPAGSEAPIGLALARLLTDAGSMTGSSHRAGGAGMFDTVPPRWRPRHTCEQSRPPFDRRLGAAVGPADRRWSGRIRSRHETGGPGAKRGGGSSWANLRCRSSNTSFGGRIR